MGFRHLLSFAVVSAMAPATTCISAKHLRAINPIGAAVPLDPWFLGPAEGMSANSRFATPVPSKSALAAFHVTSSQIGAQTPPDILTPGPQSLLIRYAILDASVGFHNVALPALAASICQAEKHLSPAALAHPAFGALPTYMFYTDNQSDPALREFLQSAPDLVTPSRVQFVNLDLDPSDQMRIPKIKTSGLDSVNLASVRRAFADMVHLPSDRPKLLLGLDISVMGDPSELLDKASQYTQNSILYMTSPGWPYTLLHYPGPQCPGLIGDFIYISRGTPLDATSFEQKLQWYLSQPVNSQRHEPACPIGALGYSAIDQFTTMLLLGEWAAAGHQPSQAGSGFCLPLSLKYLHAGSGGIPPTGGEVVLHDKLIHLRHSECPALVVNYMRAKGYGGW